MKMIIIIICSIFLFSCYPSKDKKSCEWLSTQLVGHHFLENKHYSTPGVYFVLRGCDTTNKIDYLFINEGKEFLTIKDQVSSDFFILKLYLRDIEQLFSEEITDSLQFKNEFMLQLNKSSIIKRHTRESIPKSNDHKVKFGYIIKRILE